MSILKMLEADLRHIERLIDAVGAAEPGPERVAVMERLADTVERHLRFEQSWIDPLMARIDGGTPSSEAGGSAMRAGIAALRSTAHRHDIEPALERLRSEVDRHAQADERTTFPALRAACPDELLDQLADEMSHARELARLAAEDRAIAAARASRAAVLEEFAEGRVAAEGRAIAAPGPDEPRREEPIATVGAADMTDAA